MILKNSIFLLLAIFMALPSRAQRTDSLNSKKDTTRLIKTSPAGQAGPVKDANRLRLEKLPRQAAIRSAIIPGWGQLTNRRWWKVPLVYGGFVGIGLVYEFNQRYYKIFLKEAQFRDSHPGEKQNPDYVGYSNSGIITIKDGYRRNRDLSILAAAGFYAINIIDAYVDAKFFRFDINNDLSLQVKPSVTQTPGLTHASAVPGVKLSLSL